MKKTIAMAIVIMVVLIGCSSKRINPVISIEEPTVMPETTATATATITVEDIVVDTATATLTNTIQVTSTPTNTAVVVNTSTATSTTTVISTPTATQTSTTVYINMNTMFPYIKLRTAITDLLGKTDNITVEDLNTITALTIIGDDGGATEYGLQGLQNLVNLTEINIEEHSEILKIDVFNNMPNFYVCGNIVRFKNVNVNSCLTLCNLRAYIGNVFLIGGPCSVAACVSCY